MNRTVNCLEESGYVARTPDEQDRRKVNVSLTDAGREMVGEIDAVHNPAPEALAALTSEDLAALRRLVDLLVD